MLAGLTAAYVALGRRADAGKVYTDTAAVAEQYRTVEQSNSLAFPGHVIFWHEIPVRGYSSERLLAGVDPPS